MTPHLDPLAAGLDLRLATGQDVFGDAPVKVHCPIHDDPGASLVIYHDHGYCLGCPGGRYLRRYACLALVLGLWDGNPATELSAVRAVKPRIQEFQAGVQQQRSKPRPVEPLDKRAPGQFHRYLLSCSTRLQELKDWRGFDEREIIKYEIGWTGSHFSIPVYGVSGDLRSIRYRAPRSTASTGDGSKYEGTFGHNETLLFSLPFLSGVSSVDELWITEGEFDAIAVDQLARAQSTSDFSIRSLTQTNGAGQLPGIVSAWIGLHIGVERFVLATDQDAAGEQAAWEIARALRPHHDVVRARWGGGMKDANEYLKAGGDLSSIRFKQFLSPRLFV